MTATASTSGQTGARASSAHRIRERIDGPLATAVGDAGAGHANRLPERAVTRLADRTDGRRRR